MVLIEEITEGSSLKEEGNKLFAEKRFQEAIDKYSQGIEELEFKDVDDTQQTNDETSLLYNRGCAFFHLKQFRECVADCSAALRARPMYTKALLRRALAHEQLDDIDAASSDMKSVVEQDSSLARTENVKRIEEKAAAKFEKDKVEMMSSLKELGNRFLGNFGMSTDDFKFEKDPETGSYSLKMAKTDP